MTITEDRKSKLAPLDVTLKLIRRISAAKYRRGDFVAI
jgi:hypothetical protein